MKTSSDFIITAFFLGINTPIFKITTRTRKCIDFRMKMKNDRIPVWTLQSVRKLILNV